MPLPKTSWCLVPAAIVLGGTPVFAYEKLYEATPVGEVQMKQLPARVALAAEAKGNYFNRDNQLFMQLFDYIKKQDIAMTVPVEAEIDKAGMRFFVGSDEAGNPPPNRDPVSVVSLPPRRVLSVGLRGSYNQKRFEKGKAQLEAWLAKNPSWQAADEAYAVYWHGPFMPAPFRRSEVHIPIAPRGMAALADPES